MQESAAKKLIAKHQDANISEFTEKKRYTNVSTTKKSKNSVLNINLSSGPWKATDCKILLVNELPQNVMGRDILRKLRIHLSASKPIGKTVGLISDTTIEQNIFKWIFKKYLHLCTRLG